MSVLNFRSLSFFVWLGRRAQTHQQTEKYSPHVDLNIREIVCENEWPRREVLSTFFIIRRLLCFNVNMLTVGIWYEFSSIIHMLSKYCFRIQAGAQLVHNRHIYSCFFFFVCKTCKYHILCPNENR